MNMERASAKSVAVLPTIHALQFPKDRCKQHGSTHSAANFKSSCVSRAIPRSGKVRITESAGPRVLCSPFREARLSVIDSFRKRRAFRVWWQLEYPWRWCDYPFDKQNVRSLNLKHTKLKYAIQGDSISTLQKKKKLSKRIPNSQQPSIWRGEIPRLVKNHQHRKALQLFHILQNKGVKSDVHTFVSVLKACGQLIAVEEGRNIHSQVILTGCGSDMFVGSSLVDMYARCGSILDACNVFNNMPSLDIVSWNAMIAGYNKCRQEKKALELFYWMKEEGVEPNQSSFVSVLKACAGISAIEDGRRIHAEVIQAGLHRDLVVGNSLLDMYAKCGCMDDACRAFSLMPVHDVITWSTMITGFVKCKDGEKALELFHQMQQTQVKPNKVTFLAVLSACSSITALEEGKSIHAQVIASGLESDILIVSCLVDMYNKCGNIEDACRVFSQIPRCDVFLWNTMIRGYVICGYGQEALQLFQHMRHRLEPDNVTFVEVFRACASVAALEMGKLVHAELLRSKVVPDVFVWNSLIHMYTKCGSIEDACRVFNETSARDVVSWNIMIMGHVKCGDPQKALNLFQEMQHEAIQPNGNTYVGVLNACASMGILEEGKRIHSQVVVCELESDAFVGSALVDMYAKCGSLEDACNVFNTLPLKNVVTWSAMMMGYAIHGLGKDAISLFGKMCQEGVEINGCTFLSLFSACNHSGLLYDGLYHFESMNSIFGIAATVEHYSCVVDLMSRSGYLDDAENLIKEQPCDAAVSLWTSLLGACRNHGNMQMGERAAAQLFDLDPENASGYLLLSSMYATLGKFDASKSFQQTRSMRCVPTQPGGTWIVVNNRIHIFGANPNQHPQIEEIRAELSTLCQQMKDMGYTPNADHMLQKEVQAGSKDYSLCHHREKLALAFGIISTSPGTPLRIMKNLHMCRECHTTTKLISRIVGRLISVRDINRFHHFKDGACSCGDYW